ncbi:tripartite tricarboxylate transporter TctB family protein [Salinarimonas sp. NSM]|uniref:tripartite tricarboxylate transporter TctB family protein n=1 Tax=Salinarimonas sp. NSM TaxID=3458003 RepID=UPI004035A4E3
MSRARDLIAGCAFAALGATGIALAYDLPMGSTRLPGAGAMPILLSCALLVLALALIWRTLAGGAASEEDTDGPVDTFGQGRVAVAAALIAAYAAVLSWLGFILATSILMALLFMLGAKKPLSLAPVLSGIGVTALAWALFVLALDVRLPVGAIWG